VHPIIHICHRGERCDKQGLSKAAEKSKFKHEKSVKRVRECMHWLPRASQIIRFLAKYQTQNADYKNPHNVGLGGEHSLDLWKSLEI
jgi:hypothetical protein